MSRSSDQDAYLSERDFITKYGIDSYNEKYVKSLDHNLCRIRSVKSAYGYTYGYQIETMRGDDYVTVMVYFNLGDITRTHLVRVEAIQNVEMHGALGDEVYVVTGDVARFYKEEGIYKFRWLKAEGDDFRVAFYMDGDIIQFMDGDILSFMNDSPAPEIRPD